METRESPAARGSEEKKRRFEELAFPHLNALYFAALGMSRNPRDAEDLVQETCLKAYRSLERFQQGTDFKAWIFRILINTYRDLYRRRVRGPSFVELSEEDVDAPRDRARLWSLADVEEALEKFLVDDVIRVLNALPETHRLAVILADIMDFSYKEIAGILECPLGTVMSRLNRARTLLRNSLYEYARREGLLRSPRKEKGS